MGLTTVGVVVYLGVEGGTIEFCDHILKGDMMVKGKGKEPSKAKEVLERLKEREITSEEALAELDSMKPKRAGRPPTYDHSKIAEVLRKYRDMAGGMKRAFEELRAMPGFEKISKMTLVNVASRYRIFFKAGKPPMQKMV